MAAFLKSMVDRTVSVLTCDGRHVVGVLRGCDQVTNLILEDCHERVYSTTSGVEQVVLGLYIVRGPNVAVVGELDKEADEKLNLDELKGTPLGSVVH